MPRTSKVQTKENPKPFSPAMRGTVRGDLIANDPPHASLTLTLNNQAIRDQGEMLSLTDMWKAAGADESRKPYAWLRGEDANRFIEHLGDSIGNPEARNSRFGLVDVSKGGATKGQTFAHWQVALAYAKYLSPAFHAACNVVIKERMEGRHTPPAALPGELVEEIHRILGINKMLSHKVTVIEQGMAQMQDQHVAALVALDPRVAALAYVSVNEVLDKEWKVPPKGRRSIQRKVLNRIKDHCATGAMKGTRAAYSGTWIFPRQDAIDYVRETCGSMIRDHLDKVGRQGMLKLVQK